MKFLRLIKDKIKLVVLSILLILVLFFVRGCGSITSELYDELKSGRGINVSEDLAYEDIKNRIIIVNFTHYNDPESLGHIGILNEIKNDNSNAVLIINVIEDSEIANFYISKFNITTPVIITKHEKLLNKFGLGKNTKLIVLNPKGKIAKQYREYEGFKHLYEDYLDLLTKYANKINTNILPTYNNKEKENRETFLNFPTNITYADNSKAFGNKTLLIVSDSGNNRIVISSILGKVFYIINNNTPEINGQLNFPQGVFYKDDKLYIADSLSNSIKEFDLESKEMTTILSSNDGIYYPTKIILDAKNENSIIILNSGKDNILSYNLDTTELEEVLSFEKNEISDLDYFDGKVYYINSKTKRLEYLYSEENSIEENNSTDKGKSNTPPLNMPSFISGIYKDNTGVYITSEDSISKLDGEDLSKYSYLDSIEENSDSVQEINSAHKIKYNHPNDLLGVKDRFYIADTNNHRIIIINRNTDDAEILEFSSNITNSGKKKADIVEFHKLKTEFLKAGINNKLMIDIKKGDEILEESKSFVSVFEVKDAQAKLIKNYKTSDLKNGDVVLPVLNADNEYFIHGVIYYDKEGDNNTSHMVNYQRKVKPTNSKGEEELKINLM